MRLWGTCARTECGVFMYLLRAQNSPPSIVCATFFKPSLHSCGFHVDILFIIRLLWKLVDDQI